MVSRFLGRVKHKTPEDLTLEELLSGVDVGEYGSWYEHEIFRKVSTRWLRAEDKGRFVEEEARALPGYDAAATDAVYGSRGIRDAFVLSLPSEARFGCPAVALYLHPDAPEGFPEPWSMVRFYGYEVVPRFYEPIGIHELVGWNLAERFPEAEEGDTPREGVEDPDLDPSTGVVCFRVHPNGAGRAARFARRLKEAMEELGVLCDPAVALSGGRDYDPLAVEDTHVGGPERDEHPYYRPNGSAERPGPFPHGLDFDAPRSHRVVPTAGPLVPDQGRADRLLRRLKQYAYWQGLERDLERRMEDDRIPGARMPALAEQRDEAAGSAGEALSSLLEEPEAVAGLMISMDNALQRLTEHVRPLMFYRPEDGEPYPADLYPLWKLQEAVGGLFEASEETGP